MNPFSAERRPASRGE